MGVLCARDPRRSREQAQKAGVPLLGGEPRLCGADLPGGCRMVDDRQHHHEGVHLVLPRAQWACSRSSGRHAETVKVLRIGGGGADTAFKSLHLWAGCFLD